MGVKAKLLIVTEFNELGNALKRALECVFDTESQVCGYKEALEKFCIFIENGKIERVIFYPYLNIDGFIDAGIQEICKIRKGFFRYKVPFLCMGFDKEEDIKERYPIFKEAGHYYIQLPCDLEKFVDNNIKGPTINEDQIKKLCPESFHK